MRCGLVKLTRCLHFINLRLSEITISFTSVIAETVQHQRLRRPKVIQPQVFESLASPEEKSSVI
jgi:hypothetical protein